MKTPNTTHRIWKEEIMDDFDLAPAQVESIFKDLDRVNRLLGGNTVTLDGIKQLLKRRPVDQTYRVVDVGCGNGAMLRKIADDARQRDWKFELVGIDANPVAIDLARRQSAAYSNIRYYCMDVRSEEFQQVQADIFLCTLTLHHFKDETIVGLMHRFIQNSRLGVVINDLERSKVAYHLFRAFAAVFIKNRIAVEDGLISILRSFKREDLELYQEQLPQGRHRVRWRWAFRYQWIIETEKAYHNQQKKI